MSLGSRIKSIKKADSSSLLMTPKIERFLMDTPEGVIWDDEGYALFKQISESTFGANGVRHGRFGASSRGKCMRAQMWTYLGMPHRTLLDPDTANLFNDGKWRHIRWQMMGIQSGALTHVEYPMSSPKYRVGSSADGLNATDSWLFELKGDRNLGRLLDNERGIVHEHELQIHTMFLITGWDTASYVVEDKSSQQWRERVIHRDPKIMTLVRTELEELNEHVENRTLPEPLPACQKREGPYRTCPFAKQCIGRWEQGNTYWPDVIGTKDGNGDWDT